ncbi:MAG: hypothetical protein JWQ87_5420 [Candidatus Sulfotelmatobacter sp.]|nr:hypothetical protein [Candidatus Sulfotelmatobacter sp.]
METALPTKACAEMTNVELADFIEQGAWREDAHEADATAYMEAAKRLRREQLGGRLKKSRVNQQPTDGGQGPRTP